MQISLVVLPPSSPNLTDTSALLTMTEVRPPNNVLIYIIIIVGVNRYTDIGEFGFVSLFVIVRHGVNNYCLICSNIHIHKGCY